MLPRTPMANQSEISVPLQPQECVYAFSLHEHSAEVFKDMFFDEVFHEQRRIVDRQESQTQEHYRT